MEKKILKSTRCTSNVSVKTFVKTSSKNIICDYLQTFFNAFTIFAHLILRRYCWHANFGSSFLENVYDYIYNIRWYASETCVDSRIFAIRIHLCTCLRRLTRVYANEQKRAATPARYLSQISPFCLWLPTKRLLNAINDALSAGVTCRW